MMTLYPNSTLNNDAIINDLPQASGSEGARSYPTRPNTRDVVWDKDENYYYIRVTNSANNITSLQRYSYQPDPEPTMEELFVTKDDFNSLKGEISNVKQSLQDILSIITAPTQNNAVDGQTQSNGQYNGSNKSNKQKSKSNDSTHEQ